MCERGLRDRLALTADPPLPLDLLVDGDQGLERLRAVPPAELRAGDDPRVLVEPVAHVRAGLRAVGDPALEGERAGRQRDLVERLLGRAGRRERGRARRGLDLRLGDGLRLRDDLRLRDGLLRGVGFLAFGLQPRAS